ncbi:hypothetical protein ABVT39_016223 [Epinephelus coioides]
MLSSPGLHSACLQDTDKLALMGSYNGIKWTAGGGSRLHGEDASARSALIPPDCFFFCCYCCCCFTRCCDSPPGCRFNHEDGAEVRVNTYSQRKDKPRPPPPASSPPPPPPPPPHTPHTH